MSWDGAGNFNRLFSWVADKAAGLDISSSRMDSDTNNLASVGFGNCITRDGQGQPTANLPMANFRHTGVQNAVNRTDYAAFGQVQDGLPNWSIAGGASDALTLALTPALTVLNDGQLIFARAAFANATTTPTFSPNGLPANVITKLGGVALGIGDIAGALAEAILRYNLANTRWELLNPSNIALNSGVASTGTVWHTLAPTPPIGWLMFDDTTFGSATSGSTNSNSAANQALFTMMFNGISDTFAPLLTSTGSATTRAGQGSAAAAWAANCRMFLPKVLGRALAVAGSGSGLTSFALGQTVGENNHTLIGNEIPQITSTVNVTVGGSVSVNTNIGVGGGSVSAINTSYLNGVGSTNWPGSGTFTGSGTGAGTSNNTGGAAHNNMQPSSFMNCIVKQ